VTSINVPKSTVVYIGCSADWWMKWYVNGQCAYATVLGNLTANFKTTDHCFKCPLKKGRNVIAAEVRSGSRGWRLVASVADSSAVDKAVGQKDTIELSPEQWKNTKGILAGYDLAFGKAPHQKLDIYRSAKYQKEKLPVVLAFHSGAWVSGDKRDHATEVLIDALCDSAYAVASANYLLNCDNCLGAMLGSPATCAWPENLRDCKRAICFIRKNAVSLGVDPNRIGLYGVKTGGQLALMSAFTEDGKYGVADEYKGISSKVGCVIVNPGPVDMRPSWRFFLGKATPDSVTIPTEGSPLFNVPKVCPPLLLIAEPYRPNDYDLLVVKLKAMGIVHEQIVGPGGGGMLSSEDRNACPAVLSFLRKHL